VVSPGSDVLIVVPEAEPAVAALRRRYDPAAAAGIPAHVTVIHPFAPAALLDDTLVETLAEAIASVRAFDAVLQRVAWFDRSVVWLAPEPADPFRRLTAAVASRFPHYPPYGGLHGWSTPHLTVARDAPLDELRAAESELAALLPIRFRVDQVVLLHGADAAAPSVTLSAAGTPGTGLRTRAVLPLG
jgi:2'-5' RNA ligase